MKSVMFCLLVLFCSGAQADSRGDFLQSPQFESFCEKVVVAKPPFRALEREWKNFYLLRSPSFAQTENALYLGVTEGTTENPGEYAISKVDSAEPLRVEELVRLSHPALDLMVIGDSLWALHERSLSRIELGTLEVQDTALFLTEGFGKFDRAYDMAFAQGKIFISHGARGLVVVDPDTMKMERTVDLGLEQANGHKSLATSLAVVSDHELVVGVDNQTLPTRDGQAFNGLILVNLHSFGTRMVPYQNGILSRHSKMLFDGSDLWINNAGTLQRISWKSLQSSRAAASEWVPMTYEEGGKKYAVEPRGEFFLNGSELVSCAVRSEIRTHKPEPKRGVVHRVQLPAPVSKSGR